MKLAFVDLLIKSGCGTRDDITLKKKDQEREEGLQSSVGTWGRTGD